MDETTELELSIRVVASTNPLYSDLYVNGEPVLSFGTRDEIREHITLILNRDL